MARGLVAEVVAAGRAQIFAGRSGALMILPDSTPLTASCFFPLQGNASGFVRTIERLREQQKRGDDRALMALTALCTIPHSVGVSFGATLIDARAGKYSTGRFVISAWSLS